MSHPSSASWPQFDSLDEAIEAFEAACASGQRPSIRRFLPDRGATWYLEVLQELVRVDLELRYRDGDPVSLDEYRREFPELFQSQETLQPLAFEEYRLRLRAGVPAETDDFRRRYGVDTSTWPRSDSGEPSASKTSTRMAVELSPGDKILDFVISGQLGTGAFSRVYLARQTSLSGRLVVLKISSVRLNEADRLARLQHTNIVPVYSVHEYAGSSVICMPWFGATTLKDVIEALKTESGAKDGETFLSTVLNCDSKTLSSLRTEALPEQKDVPVAGKPNQLHKSRLASLNHEQAGLWIVQQLADGLQHAHARGILHRDMKPANVLLTEDGLPMILDFNLAADHESQLTDGVVGGTLPYMSPEQLESIDSFRSLSPASDVYSSGVILFELLTGRLPFTRNSGDRAAMIAERLSGSPGVRILNPEISRDTESIVQRCLAPAASDRYVSANELSEDLQRQLSSQPLKYAANRSIRERAGKWIRRHPRIASATSVMLVSAVALISVAALWLNSADQNRTLRVREQVAEFRSVVPELHAECFMAAAGQTSRDSASQRVQEAVVELVSPNGLLLPEISRRLSESEVTEVSSQIQDLRIMTAVLSQQLNGSDVISSPTAGNDQTISSRVPAVSATPTDLHTQTPAPAKSPSVALQHDNSFLAAFEMVVRQEHEEALRLLLPVADAQPGKFAVVLLQGMLEREADDFADAEASLTAAIALQPELYYGWYQRGVCRLNARRFSLALEDFDRVLQLRPDRLPARVSRALALQGLGRLEESLADLTTAIDGGFPETRVYAIRAKILKQLNRPDEAARDIRLLLEKTPADEVSWISRGLAFLPHHAESALADFRSALRLNRKSHEAWRNLSMVLSEYLHRPDESVEVLNEAVKYHPDDAYLWAGRGVLHARAGRRDAAVRDAVEAASRSREALLQYMVACIYSLTAQQVPEDSTEALKWFAASLLADPQLADLARTDGDLMNLRKLPECLKLVDAASELRKASTGTVQPR